MILVNGNPQETISVHDRGLHYGDGVFETMRVHQGSIPLWRYHFARLSRDCQRLAIPLVSEKVLLEDIARLAANVENGVIKLIYTRGCGPRGYQMPASPMPTRIILAGPAPQHPASNLQDGIVVKICRTRIASNTSLAGIKHLNRLENVLAKAELTDPVIAEGLLQNDQNYLIEGTMSNLFMVSHGLLKTPALHSSGVRGVMRELILELAAASSIPVQETDITVNELLGAEEAFVCNSIIGIWPIRRIEEKQFDGVLAHASFTRTLQQLVAQRCQA